MGIYGAQRAFFDPFARKFNFGATHFFKPYPFTSKFQSVSSASRGRPSFPALAPSLQLLKKYLFILSSGQSLTYQRFFEK